MKNDPVEKRQQLFEAAPELLQAAKDTITVIREHAKFQAPWTRLLAQLAVLDAAIVKAEGTQETK